MLKKSEAEFLKWMPLVLNALREHGGSATPREVYDTVARISKVPDSERYEKLGGGGYRYTTNIAFARQYLLWEGYLASPKRGLWVLTPAGQKKRLSLEEAGEIFRKWADYHANKRKAGKDSESLSTSDESKAGTVSDPYTSEMLNRLQSLPPAEFERFCADLLRHLGMESVEVTGGGMTPKVDPPVMRV